MRRNRFERSAGDNGTGFRATGRKKADPKSTDRAAVTEDSPVNINTTGWSPDVEDRWLAQSGKTLRQQTARQPNWREIFISAGRNNTMDFIDEHVAIGNFREATDLALLRKHGIRAAVSLDGTLAGKQPPDLGLEAVKVVRLVDGPGNDARLFQLAVNTLAAFAAQYGRVLVQCHAGRSRSIVVAAGYLMKTRMLDAPAALQEVLAVRAAQIAPGLEKMLYRLDSAGSEQ